MYMPITVNLHHKNVTGIKGNKIIVFKVQQKLRIYMLFFSIWVFFHNHSRTTGLQGKGEGEGISLTPHCHFYLLHRNLDISRAITAETSPLHIGNSWTRTENLWFLSACR